MENALGSAVRAANMKELSEDYLNGQPSPISESFKSKMWFFEEKNDAKKVWSWNETFFSIESRVRGA